MKTITFDEKKWKLVPIHPTEAMLRKGLEYLGSCVGSCGEADPPSLSEIADCYEGMLKAAPDSEGGKL